MYPPAFSLLGRTGGTQLRLAGLLAATRPSPMLRSSFVAEGVHMLDRRLRNLTPSTPANQQARVDGSRPGRNWRTSAPSAAALRMQLSGDLCCQVRVLADPCERRGGIHDRPIRPRSEPPRKRARSSAPSSSLFGLTLSGRWSRAIEWRGSTFSEHSGSRPPTSHVGGKRRLAEWRETDETTRPRRGRR